MITFACSGCGAKLQGKEDKAGSAINCPKCSTRLIVPSPADPVSGGDDFEDQDIGDLLRGEQIARRNTAPITHGNKTEGAYPACQLMRTVLKVTGFLIFAVGIVVLLFSLRALSEQGVEAFLFLLGLSMACGLTGAGQFASAELLGGFVNYLLKHGCRPD